MAGVHGCSKAWCNLVLLSLFLLHWRMQYIQSMNSYSFLFLSQIMMQQRPSFDLIYGITNALLLISLPVTAKFNLNVILCTLCAKCCGTVQRMSGSILNIIYTIFFKLAFKWHSTTYVWLIHLIVSIAWTTSVQPYLYHYGNGTFIQLYPSN